MAEPRRFIDVWITDPEKVYREVPYTVVADWVQQGRLIDDDKVRSSGKGDWVRIADSPDFSPYLLKPEPNRADDQAEALEPIGVDFVSSSPRRRETEDDDPDMIPLIDVSLVLLIFFMMTAAGGGLLNIPTPTTANATVVEYKDGLAIGIDLQGADRVPVYFLSVGANSPAREDSNLRSLDELLQRLDQHLAQAQGPVEVTINAHEDLRASVVRELTAALDTGRRRDQITNKYTGVKGKES